MVVLLLVSSLALFQSSSSAIIPSVFTPTNTFSWHESEKYCQYKFNSNLVSIHSQSQFDDVLNAISKYEVFSFWIGLYIHSNITWELNTTSFSWSDNTTFNYSPSQSLPSPIIPITGKKYCIAFQHDIDWHWCAVDCNNKHYPICNDPSPNNASSTNIPTTSPTMNGIDISQTVAIPPTNTTIFPKDSDIEFSNEQTFFEAVLNDKLLLYGFIIIAIIFGCIILLCIAYFNFKIRINTNTKTDSYPHQRDPRSLSPPPPMTSGSSPRSRFSADSITKSITKSKTHARSNANTTNTMTKNIGITITEHFRSEAMNDVLSPYSSPIIGPPSITGSGKKYRKTPKRSPNRSPQRLSPQTLSPGKYVNKSPKSKSKSHTTSITKSLPIIFSNKKITPSYGTSIQTSLHVRSPNSTQENLNSHSHLHPVLGHDPEDVALISDNDDSHRYKDMVSEVESSSNESSDNNHCKQEQNHDQATAQTFTATSNSDDGNTETTTPTIRSSHSSSDEIVTSIQTPLTPAPEDDDHGAGLSNITGMANVTSMTRASTMGTLTTLTETIASQQSIDRYIDDKRKISVALDEDSEENDYMSPNDVAIKQNIFSINMNLKMLRMQHMERHILMLPEQNEDDTSDHDGFVDDTSESSTNEFADTDDEERDMLNGGGSGDTSQAIACSD